MKYPNNSLIRNEHSNIIKVLNLLIFIQTECHYQEKPQSRLLISVYEFMNLMSH